MPRYDFKCPEHGQFEEFYAYSETLPDETKCYRCKQASPRVLFYSFGLYGTEKFGDKSFRDASEALGRTVRSTKEIDKAEASGEIRAITNPSRHRTYKDKK